MTHQIDRMQGPGLSLLCAQERLAKLTSDIAKLKIGTWIMRFLGRRHSRSHRDRQCLIH